jgi:rhodanese-related sulfurtransferase
MALVFSALVIFSCKKDSADPSPTSAVVYRRITASEAGELASAGNVVLLDVRTEQEFREQRIVGATLLPVDDLAAVAHTVLPDKNARILVYCRRGKRSKIAAETLIEMGYTDVYDFGGIEGQRAFKTVGN